MSPIRSVHVLMVDDEPNLCALTKSFLETSEVMEVDTFCSVAEARGALGKKHYDAIVSDYQMPVEDGIQFLKSLRFDGNNIPFILFTGKGREEVVIEALNNGADSYLQKGGKPAPLYAELEHRIHAAVRRRQAEEALKKSEERYKRISETTTDFVFSCIRPKGGEYALDWMAGDVEGILGYSIEEMLIMGCWGRLVLSEDASIFHENVTDLTPGTSQDSRLRIRTKSGEVRWLAVNTTRTSPEEDIARDRVFGGCTDISERMQAEAALKESEEHYRAIFERSPIAIELYDAEGSLVHVNPAGLELFGVEDAHEIGGFSLFADPNIGEEHKEELRRGMSIRYHGPFDFEKVRAFDLYRTRCRGVIELDVLVTPLRWRGGSTTGYLIQIQDITERKRVEEALMKDEERFHSLFINHDSVMLLIEGETGAIVDANLSAQRFYGRDRGSLCQLHIEDINMLPPEEIGGLMAKAMRSQRNHFVMPHRVANGVVKTVEVHSSPISIGGRQILFSIINDVTEHESMEGALRDSEEKFRHLFEMESDALFMIDRRDGHILEANGAAERLYGYSRSEMLQMKNTDLSAQPEETMRAMVGAATDVPLRYHRKKDGTRFPLAITANHFEWRGIPIILCAMRDITERKRAEGALQEASRKLNLLSSITRHDIVNQLLVLQGQLALLEGEHLHPSSNVHLQRAEVAAERISAMIQFTKEYEDIGVHAPIWQDIQTLVLSSAKEVPMGAVAVTNDVPNGIEIFADPLIEKAFHNLIDNAMKHGSKLTKIHFYVEERDGAQSIICEDDGVGISAEDKGRLFEKGFGKNHGLGLFLSREILAITGIIITETGNEGQGARFEMQVPPGAWRRKF